MNHSEPDLRLCVTQDCERLRPRTSLSARVSLLYHFAFSFGAFEFDSWFVCFDVWVARSAGSCALSRLDPAVWYTLCYRYLRVWEVVALRGVNRALFAFANALLSTHSYIHHHATIGFVPASPKPSSPSPALLPSDAKSAPASTASASASTASAASASAATASASAGSGGGVVQRHRYLRGQIWKVVCGADVTVRAVRSAQRKERIASIYRELSARTGKALYDVQKDTLRTLIHLPAFSDEKAAYVCVLCV
jgi:hypothetical protein